MKTGLVVLAFAFGLGACSSSSSGTDGGGTGATGGSSAAGAGGTSAAGGAGGGTATGGTNAAGGSTAGTGGASAGGAGGATSFLNGCAPTDFVDLSKGTAADRVITVGPSGFAFAPKCITIAAGQTVDFSWSFGAHPLAPGKAPSRASDPDSTTPTPITAETSGMLKTFTFATPGMYGYYCSLHEGLGMYGVVQVQLRVTHPRSSPIAARQLGDDDLEHLARDLLIGLRHTRQRAAHRGLDGTGAHTVDLAPAGGQLEARAPAVVGIGEALGQPAQLEAPKDAGHGRAVEKEQLGEPARCDAREASDQAQRDALRTGDAELELHALRAALQAVVERPQQAHEIERRAKAGLRLFAHDATYLDGMAAGRNDRLIGKTSRRP